MVALEVRVRACVVCVAQIPGDAAADDFVAALERERRPRLQQGRNHFESVFALTEASSNVVQFIWINFEVRSRQAILRSIF